MKSLLTFALAAATLPSAHVAMASPMTGTPTSVSKGVRTDDLDLMTAAGRARLEHRIAAAVAKVCSEATPGSPAPPPYDLTCVREHVAQARIAADHAIELASKSRPTDRQTADARK